MAANHVSHDDQVKRRHTLEGPKNHIIAYILSIVLTVLAFIAITYRDTVDGTFVLMFIVALALIQAIIQAVFWMHLKDRGHLIPRIFLITAVLFVSAFIVMAVYWVWW